MTDRYLKLTNAQPLFEKGWELCRTEKSRAFVAGWWLTNPNGVDQYELTGGTATKLRDNNVVRAEYHRNLSRFYFVAIKPQGAQA